MVKKIYVSNSILHFSLCGRRIAFTPLTKESYYATKDEAEQRALEHHVWFGDKFRLKGVEEDAAAGGGADEAVKGAAAATEVAAEKVAFATLADAKEWLSEKYGVSRGAIKTCREAVEAGLRHGAEVTIKSAGAARGGAGGEASDGVAAEAATGGPGGDSGGDSSI